MPYSNVSEVPDSVPAEFKKQWLEVWNSAYAAAKKDGQSNKDAEASAFAQANGVMKKREEAAAAEKTKLAEISYDRIQSMIRAALEKKFPPKKDGSNYCWVKEVFPSYAIVEHQGRLLRFPYEIKDDQASIGEAQEVETSYISASEVRDGLVRIAIAYTGENFEQDGKHFDITVKDLEEMRRNLAQRERPLDYQHYSGLAAEGAVLPPEFLRAAGWIKRPDTIEPFLEGQKILWAWADLTPACLAAIRNKELRYFSPEFTWAGKDEHGKSIGTALKAGAILIRPFLQHLPPIEIGAADYPQLLEAVALSESHRRLEQSATDFTDKEKKKMAVKNFKLKCLADGEHKGRVGVFEGDEMVGLVDGKLPKDEPDADDVKAREIAAADTAFLAEAAKAKPAEILMLAERRTSEGKLSMAGYLRAQKIAALVDTAVAAGKILPKQRENFFVLAGANYDAAAAVLAEAKPVIDLTSRGISGGETMTAKETVNAGVAQLMAEKKIPYAKALARFARENPAVWAEYEKASTIRTKE
jgi:hypothetical protein